ncbi:hypothetical protein [Terrisporobacter muris]|uniref:Uncharacterized protein n=1 Tax=Terrisporobacter muris TaxID=2963284 RepID=A0A9X2MA22_9FIRM|nr:hypothetical protein [Terrisporobacter muris]MCR1822353.1 hypothetical protein [Terrisporobacter muris]SCH73445.1 Uncharacterised protein [uncultured Clostridium sp.]
MDEHRTLNIEEQLKSISNELGIDYDNLKSKTKKHLLNIETAITNRELKYSELVDELKGNKVTLSSISDDAKISRQTLYNNKELKAYINFRTLQVNELNPYYQIDALKEKINKLNQKLELMINRDIDTEILRYENQILLEQIKNKDNTITRMNEQNTEMERRIKELKKDKINLNSTTSTSKGKVVTFVKDK